MDMKDIASKNNGNYEETDQSGEWAKGNTNNGMGTGCPDGTHPSDYTKIGGKVDMNKSK